MIKTFPITDAALCWLELILTERFGHRWHLARGVGSLHLTLEGAGGSVVFDTLQAGFTEARSNQPFTSWDAEREGWHVLLDGALPAPGVADLLSPLIETRAHGHVIHYDILGLTYWMLARVEEIGRIDLDEHQRFPATASHAFKHGYLDRPVVDEWLHLLGQVMQREWPGLELKRHSPRTLVSCDVDSPFAWTGSLKTLVRRVGGDLLKRRSLQSAVRSIVGSWYARRGDHRHDPHRQGLDLIMETNERVGRSVAFYFIPDNTDARLDNRVSLDDPRMRNLLREIHARGHEIGIHPGYNTYRHPEAMERSVATLRRLLTEEGIVQPLLGGRQHFLRWETPTTARLWDDNGLDYDTTLSYADRPGFRCGTCFEYPMFDPIDQRPLRLRERPLIVMECSVIDKKYMGLGSSKKALSTMKSYQDTCYRLGGDFTLLWHNSHLESAEDREIYSTMVSI